MRLLTTCIFRGIRSSHGAHSHGKEVSARSQRIKKKKEAFYKCDVSREQHGGYMHVVILYREFKCDLFLARSLQRTVESHYGYRKGTLAHLRVTPLPAMTSGSFSKFIILPIRRSTI